MHTHTSSTVYLIKMSIFINFSDDTVLESVFEKVFFLLDTSVESQNFFLTFIGLI